MFLKELQLSGMEELLKVGENSFSYLESLKSLKLTDNKKLTTIHHNAFKKTENLLENVSECLKRKFFFVFFNILL